MLNCREAQDLFGTALDGVLSGNLRSKLLEHLSLCRGCNKEFELESIAKSLVSRSSKRIETPSSVRTAVVKSLNQEYVSTTDPIGWAANFFRRVFSAPVLVAGAGIIVLYLIFPQPLAEDQSAVHTSSNDIINQTLSNFQLIRDGRLKPSMTSCFPEGVVGYFEKNGISFAVNIIPMENCEWYGAISGNYGGVKLAQVVYKIGDDLIYVYEVGSREGIDGTTLSIPPAARKSLAQTGWYTDPAHPQCNVVLWKSNGTLCAASSTMKKERLVSLLASR